MAIMDLFTSLQTIVNERFAKDVRQAIHDGVYRANQVADENKDLVDRVAIRQDAVEQYNNQMIEEMTDKDVVSAPEIIQARGSKDTLAQRLDDTDSMLTRRTRLTPDDFEGTDIEKFQQAYDYAIANDITDINLTRSYNLTGGSVYLPVANQWKRVVFHGGEIVKGDAGFIFDSDGTGKFRHAPHFNGTRFVGEVDGVIIYNADKMIRFELNSSHFKRIALLKTDGYLQTLRLHQCETEELGGIFIDADTGFDVEIAHHRGEQSASPYPFLKMVTKETDGISFFGLRIINSLLEGYTNTAPIVIGTGYGLSISQDYFEANKETVHIVSGPGTKRIQGVIEQSVFGRNSGEYDIRIDPDIITTWLKVVRNTATNITSGKTFCNRVVGTRNDMLTNNMPSGVAHYPNSLTTQEENTGYTVTKVALSGGGVGFRIPLQLKHTGLLYNADNLQWLINAVGIVGSSVIFRAHLTGILSVDVHVVEGLNKAVLSLDTLSTRNTSGNLNGNVENPTDVDYFFLETGTKEIDYNVTTATIQINFPNFVENAKTKLVAKGINELMQLQRRDS